MTARTELIVVVDRYGGYPEILDDLLNHYHEGIDLEGRRQFKMLAKGFSTQLSSGDEVPWPGDSPLTYSQN